MDAEGHHSRGNEYAPDRFELSKTHIGTLTDTSEDDDDDLHKPGSSHCSDTVYSNESLGQFDTHNFGKSYTDNDEVNIPRKRNHGKIDFHKSTGSDDSDSSSVQKKNSKKKKYQKMSNHRSETKNMKNYGCNDREDKISKNNIVKTESRHVKRSFPYKDDDEDKIPIQRRKCMGIMFSKSMGSDESDSSYPTSHPKKKSENENLPDYGPGMKILKNYGYSEGQGLGKSGQGRAEPVSASTQHGRRGLGFVPASQGKPYEGNEWDQSNEIVVIQEIPDWMDESPQDELDRNVLDNWMVIGEPKLYINDEDDFCDPKILQDILSLKTVFDKIKQDTLHTLVTQCNLYETIKNVFFLNRAAMKMANMDAVFDFMFTNPMTENNEPAVPENELLYFADVCAGPGGFTEYVLWRKKWLAKGFGFTLRDQSDFNLSAMRAGPTESFYPYYGKCEDGNVFNPENLTSLKDFVIGQTDGKGVHFMMADGGFSVEGEENIQEIKSKQLYLCQCIAALSLVRNGGNFVVKLFDVFTSFSVGLIYLMYKSFKRVCIHKPVTSRPANSERYLICKWKRETSDAIENYLFYVNERIWHYTNNGIKKDIVELVPMEVIKADKAFFEYIYRSNNTIGRNQINSLLKIRDLNNDRTLLDNILYDDLKHEQKKADIRKRCLEFWQVPDDPKNKDYKKISPYLTQITTIAKSLNEDRHPVNEDTVKSILEYQPKIVTPEIDTSVLDPTSTNFNMYDWYFMFCSNMKDSAFHFYLSIGNVYRLEGKYWRLFDGISLPEGTLIYAETVSEKRGKTTGIHSSNSLHIVDAFRLGHENISHLCLKIRNQRIKLFCQAINKPSSLKIPIRCKNLYRLMNIKMEINKLVERELKNKTLAMTASVPNMRENNDTYFCVESMIFFKFTKHPWIMALSQRNQCIYLFNVKTGQNKKSIESSMHVNAFDSFLSSFKCPLNVNESYYDFLMRWLT